MRKRVTHPATNGTGAYLWHRRFHRLRVLGKWMFSPRLVGLYVALFAVVYFYPLFKIAYGAAQEGFLSFLVSHRLVVQDIYLEGQKYSDEKDIIQALAVQVNDPIIHIDLAAMRKRLEALPWVYHASVERQLPSTMAVHISERTPTFLWQKDGRLRVVDSRGYVIEDKDTSRFSDLIILVGEDAPSLAPSLLPVLAEDRELLSLVSSLTRISGRRWDVRLYNQVEIKLPEENIRAAWALLSKLNAGNRHLFRNVKTIDLRLAPEKIFIK